MSRAAPAPFRLAAMAALAWLAAAGPGLRLAAQPAAPAASPVREVGFDQRIGAKLPLDATFQAEDGTTVRLGDYFGKRPVVLSLAYYECPMLCGLALEGLAKSLKGFALSPAEDFDVVTISFNPREKPALARAKKDNLVALYGRPGAEKGWHFLTGGEEQIRRVTEAAGFRYRWDEGQKQYAHPTGIVLVTPDGTLSRYFFGVEYASRDLRLGLSEASEGKVGGKTAQLLLLCYQYNPATGKYTAATMKALKVLALATAVAIVSLVLVLLRREKLRARAQVGVSA